jgi:hypothetical protein
MKRGIWLFGLLSIFGFQAAAAWGCQICQFPNILSQDSYCKPVLDGETGVTNCVNSFDPFGGSSNSHGQWTCTEDGDYCSIITVGGGGGGGRCTAAASGCPAECFSCEYQ